MAAMFEGTGEVNWWVVEGLDVCFGYQGSDAGFVSLTANTPEVVWIADTMTRRWLKGHCVCGCGQMMEGDGEPGETPFLLEECKARFIERVSKLEFDEGDRNWVISTLDENRDFEETGNVYYFLRTLYRAVWKEEIESGLRRLVGRSRATLEELDHRRAEAKANRERARLALGLSGDEPSQE